MDFIVCKLSSSSGSNTLKACVSFGFSENSVNHAAPGNVPVLFQIVTCSVLSNRCGWLPENTAEVPL